MLSDEGAVTPETQGFIMTNSPRDLKMMLMMLPPKDRLDAAKNAIKVEQACRKLAAMCARLDYNFWRDTCAEMMGDLARDSAEDIKPTADQLAAVAWEAQSELLQDELLAE